MIPRKGLFGGPGDVVSRDDFSHVCTDETSSGPTTTASIECDKTADLRIAGAPNSIAEFTRTQDGCVPTGGEAVARFRTRLSAESPYSAPFSALWASN